MASFAYYHVLGFAGRETAGAPRPVVPEVADDGVADAGDPVSDRWFFDSSFELKRGLVVREVAPDAFPKDAFERLFHR